MPHPLEEVRAEFIALRSDLQGLAVRWTALMDKIEAALDFDKGASELIAKRPIRGAMVEPAKYLCPYCEAPMRLRNSSRGEFYGCSNYPECEGTRNLNGSNSSRSGCKRLVPRTAKPASKSSLTQEELAEVESHLQDDPDDCPL